MAQKVGRLWKCLNARQPDADAGRHKRPWRADKSNFFSQCQPCVGWRGGFSWVVANFIRCSLVRLARSLSRSLAARPLVRSQLLPHIKLYLANFSRSFFFGSRSLARSFAGRSGAGGRRVVVVVAASPSGLRRHGLSLHCVCWCVRVRVVASAAVVAAAAAVPMLCPSCLRWRPFHCERTTNKLSSFSLFFAHSASVVSGASRSPNTPRLSPEYDSPEQKSARNQQANKPAPTQQQPQLAQPPCTMQPSNFSQL